MKFCKHGKRGTQLFNTVFQCHVKNVIELLYSEHSYLSSLINKCISGSKVKQHGQSILPIEANLVEWSSKLYAMMLET